MKIQFLQDGGFTGVQRGCRISLSDLPPEIESLAKLLLERNEHQDPAPSGARDLQQYTFQILDGASEKEVKFNDLNIPANFQPLVRYFLRSSKPLSVK